MFLKAFFNLQFWLDEIKALNKQVKVNMWCSYLRLWCLLFVTILCPIESERPCPELLYSFVAYMDGHCLS